jgi:hypothetical protein
MKLPVVAAVLIGLSWAGAANAQTVTAMPSAAQRCLTRGDVKSETPVYPREAYEARISAHVVAQLTFERPDAQPRIRIDDEGISRVFIESVHDFVRAYRVPCLEPGQRAQLRQEFVFRPTDGRRVRAWLPQDADGQRQARLAACKKRNDNVPRPDYPTRALMDLEQGTVVFKLRFEDADRAPQIVLADDSVNGQLIDAAREHAAGWRLPCHEGGPVEMLMLYQFFIEGTRQTVLAHPTFANFLRAVKGIQQANLYFDFDTMGCPFDVRLRLYQPHADNEVGELGEPHPERRFFLDWLRRQQLALDARSLNRVVGQHMDLRVPCGRVDLGDRRGGGASQ